MKTTIMIKEKNYIPVTDILALKASLTFVASSLNTSLSSAQLFTLRK